MNATLASGARTCAPNGNAEAAPTLPSQPALTRLERYLVHQQALWVLDRAGLLRQECQNVEQELVSRYYARRKSFDSARGDHTAFFRVVLRRLGANCIRESKARKRRRQDEYAFDDLDVSSNCDRRLRIVRRSAQEQAELTHDVAAVVAKLPPGLRALAHRLKEQSLMDASHELGIAHSTLSGWVRAIRKQFEDAGLREYM